MVDHLVPHTGIILVGGQCLHVIPVNIQDLFVFGMILRHMKQGFTGGPDNPTIGPAPSDRRILTALIVPSMEIESGFGIRQIGIKADHLVCHFIVEAFFAGDLRHSQKKGY